MDVMPTVLGKRTRSGNVFAIADDSNASQPHKRSRHSKSSKETKQTFVIHDDASEPSSSADSEPVVVVHVATPTTPRHRDALSKKLQQHPATPQHRIKAASISITPHSNTPTTPRTVANIYSDARRVFSRGAHAGPLVGRQQESQEITSFITGHLEQKTGGCLYVSGPPGTGKSALVGSICKTLMAERSDVTYATVNCMSVKSASDVYTILRNELSTSDNIFATGDCAALEQKFLRKASRMYMVMLDEVDQLLTLDLNVLYKLFEWSLHPSSSMVLIGISNALDLTDRALPKLKARNLKPMLLPFLPYSASQIASIISSRARSLLPPDTTAEANFTPLIMPPAIQLISKKVASQNGDLRKAFDIAQRAIEIAETETIEKFSQHTPSEDMSPVRVPLGENPNLSSPSSVGSRPSPKKWQRPPTASSTAVLQDLKAENAPRATIAHVIRVTAAAFNNGTQQRLAGLNLQQKAVLCSLAALEQRNRDTVSSDFPNTPKSMSTPSSRSIATAPTMRSLYDAYCTLCRRDNLLHALSMTEFRDVVSNLETLSLVSAVDGKAGMFAMPMTPSKKGRGSSFGSLVRVDDRRVSSVFGAEELSKSMLQDQSPGADVLRRMLVGDLL